MEPSPFTPKPCQRSLHDQYSDKKMIQSTPDRLYQNQISPNVSTRKKSNKKTLAQKMGYLKQKKDQVKQALKKRLQRGPKRIISNFLVSRNKLNLKRSGQKKQEDEIEEVQCSFDEQHSTQQQIRTSYHRSKQQFSFSQDYFANINKKESKMYASRSIDRVQPNTRCYLKVIRRNQGRKYLWPQFVLVNPKDNQQILYAKKTGTFTFIIREAGKGWNEDNPAYLGKLVSTFSGSLINCHLRLTDPESGKNQDVLCASICYNNGYLQFSKPRSISVYLYNFYQHGDIHILKKAQSIKQIYESNQNRSKITCLHSKKPTYQSATKSYSLNFGGRAAVGSIKNFILQSSQNANVDCLLFGKKGKDQYNIDFVYPLSPMIAFAIALTSFNGKLICE